MTPNVSVIIPWRPDGGRRTVIFDWVVARWHAQFPTFEVVVGDSDPNQPFNRGAARNAAAVASSGTHLVIADADTIVPRQSIIDGLNCIRGGTAWTVAYQADQYFNLRQGRSDWILTGHPGIDPVGEFLPDEIEHQLTSTAGMLIVPRRGFEDAGGYDPGFQAWGYEDDAFREALNTLWGQYRRVGTYAAHLWHERGDATFEAPGVDANQRRMSRYRRAAGRPTQMRQVVETR